MTAALDASRLRVTRGEVTAEELAALVVVLNTAIASAAATQRERSAPVEWNAPHRSIRRPLVHGVSAWRRSALPH